MFSITTHTHTCSLYPWFVLFLIKCFDKPHFIASQISYCESVILRKMFDLRSERNEIIQQKMCSTYKWIYGKCAVHQQPSACEMVIFVLDPNKSKKKIIHNCDRINQKIPFHWADMYEKENGQKFVLCVQRTKNKNEKRTDQNSAQ